MSYKALYRTYRPQRFGDIVGQEVIVRTIQQATKNNKISHAYLFSGPRGTGKTSLARILAKAINCNNSNDGEPCNECEHCVAITKGSHPDIIEIDAASNNGVDEIRDIREKVRFLPGLVRYKVYIIDEVHMLSQGAFNALLKTLEEPPKHVVFILATTEPHKIPSTILSRCQRFDFKSLSIKTITDKLNEVVKQENIKIDDEAVITIAESAEGGMRDALSYLDQAISFSDEIINVDDVNEVTGSVSNDKIINLARSIEEKNITKVLQDVNQLLDLGKEPNKLVNNMLQFYRDCLLYKNADHQSFDKFIFEKEEFQKIANEIEDDRIFYYVNVLSNVQYQMRFSNNPRVFFEVSLIKMINMDQSELELIERVQELEYKTEALALNKVQMNGDDISVDNEQVAMLDMKLNNVINELSRLELHKLIQKVNSLEQQTNNADEIDYTNINKRLAELEEKILENTSLNAVGDFDANKYEADILGIHNQIDDINHQISGFKILNERFNSLELEIKKLESQFTTSMAQTGSSDAGLVNKLEQQIVNISKELDDFKLFFETESKRSSKVIQKDHKGASSDELQSLLLRVDDLEDKLYKLIAGTLQSQTPLIFGKNKRKQSSKQITLFDDKITDIKDLKLTRKNVEPQGTKEKVINPIKIIEEVETLEVEKTKEEIKNTEEISKTEKDKNVNVTSATTSVNDDVESIRIKDTRAKENQYPTGQYTTYDARIVERILHASRTEEARKDRETINNLWKTLDQGIEPRLLSTAEILKEGTVGAVGNKELIIVFDDAAIVNQVMRPGFKRDAEKVFKHAFNFDIRYYMALPIDTWQEKRVEYINQYNIGIKFPTLQIIDNPLLYEIEPQLDGVNDRQKTIEKTIELFGEDLVKVK